MGELLLIKWLPELMEALARQLERDEERWGDEWRHRPIAGQVSRTFQRIVSYWIDYCWDRKAFPWLKVIGGAYICWIRLRHPEYAVEPMRKPIFNEQPPGLEPLEAPAEDPRAVEWYQHHGKYVAVRSNLRDKHREHCLCFLCVEFNPHDREMNCDIANKLYAFDCEHGLVTPVWECPVFKDRDPHFG